MNTPFPLTGLQEAYLVGTGNLLELGGVRPTYYLELEVAGLDPDRAQTAVHQLIARHEQLRTVIRRDGTQCVLPGSPPAYRMSVTDLRGLAPAQQERAIDLARREIRDAGVDPFGWPLFDVRLQRLRAHRYRVHIGMSLMLLDAGGMHRVADEWLRLYEDPECDLPRVVRTYRERRLELRSRPASEQYWRKRTETLPLAPQLPTVFRPGPAGRSVRRLHRLTAAEYRGFCERFRARRVLPTAALLHTFAEVLGRWAVEPRFCVAVFHQSEASRDSAADGFAGQLGTVLPLAVDLAADADPDRRAAALQRQLWNDMRHGDVDGTSIVRRMTAGRGWLPHPALPCVFTSLLGPDGRERPGGRMRCRTVTSGIRRPHVLIDNQVQPVGDGVVECVWDTVDDAFPPGLPDLMFDAYREMLTCLARGADHPAPIAPPAPRPAPAARLEDGFLASAAATPDAVALAEGGSRVSYGQLARRSARIAAGLRARGIGRGDVVALRTVTGRDRIAAALGVLRAGAAFHVAADGTSLAQLDERLRPALIVGTGGAADPPTVTVESLARALAPGQGPAGRPGDAACVLDEDPPIRMTHGAAAAMSRDAADRLDLSRTDRVLAAGHPGGRTAIRDLFGAFTAGATVVLPEPDAVAAGARHAVTVWSSPVRTAAALTEQADPQPPVRAFLLTEDADTLAERLRRRWPQARIVRVTGYGDTETWGDGPPLGDRWLAILDHESRPRAAWAAGDIHVTGPFLPIGCGSSYPTGLLGRRLPDGTVESLGSVGRQVALHGALVHPGQIERLLRRDPRVADARVVAQHPPGATAGLAAFVVPAVDDVDGLAIALRQHLRRLLPARLIPDIRTLDALPAAPAESPTLLPRLTALCAHLLGCPPPAADDDLFAIGADSLLAVRLSAEVEAEWGVRLPLDRLLEQRTLRRLAVLIDESVPAPRRSSAPARGDR